MKDTYRIVVIGGGIVGCSVLYHLARRGVTDVALLERQGLTAGSTWHAAGGFHGVNADTRVAALQRYAMDLYPAVAAESGRDVGLHVAGSLKLASTPQRWTWLRSHHAWLRARGADPTLLTPEEAAEMVPILDPTGLEGALHDPAEGYLDPYAVTTALAAAAAARGADVIEQTQVLALHPLPEGGWQIETGCGQITTEHVVNAAGLWARRVGAMVGVDHPVVPILHHYMVTEEIPEVSSMTAEMPKVVDLEGATYLHREGGGVALGVYERNPRHWQIQGPDWNFGRELLAEDLDRIMPELSNGMRRFPVLAETGIRRWVHGPFTITPDGNPLVGPVEGVPGYWAACGCMAGLSQGPGIGLALADWIIDGDPGMDVAGLDVARFGPYAAGDRYLCETTSQFYGRRFVVTYPNEELPAGRPQKVTPAYDTLAAAGARFTVRWGLEVPMYFAPDGFTEEASLGRSNAEPIVGAEVEAVRTRAGLAEIAHHARYEVTGGGAERWLDHLLAARLPEEGRIRLAPMLSPAGKLVGDLSVACVGPGRYWLIGSYGMQAMHTRWFAEQLPGSGVQVANITDRWMGFSISGPGSRDIVDRVVDGDVSADAFPSFGVRWMDVGEVRALVARISFTGELGFEIVVPTEYHLASLDLLRVAGADDGVRLVGTRAANCLRIEKGYGVWSAEFRHDATPGMSYLRRHVDLGKGTFIGRDAAQAEAENGPPTTLVVLEIDAARADAARDDGVWLGDRAVGVVTSGAYGHHVGKSLALAYIDVDVVRDRPDLTVLIVGEPRVGRILSAPAYDPASTRLRDHVSSGG